VASVSARQDVRLQGGAVYLTVGCDIACSLYAHGHLSLRQHGRHLRLRSARTRLAANGAKQIELSLSSRTEAALLRALRAHHRVEALIEIDVSSAGQASKSYPVRVQLSYR
jgi:hypothetical protein